MRTNAEEKTTKTLKGKLANCLTDQAYVSNSLIHYKQKQNGNVECQKIYAE